jgi:ribosomal protein S18 acetylase RimI-like enzyme
MSVRSASREDLEHLVDLMSEVVDEHVCHLPYVFKQATREDMVEYLTELLDSPDAWVFAACSGPEVVGYMLCTIDADPGNPFFNPRRLLYIEALAVTADHRRGGHGADLLDAARTVAAEQGLDRIEFETWGFNQQAIDYFSARGFGTQSVRMTGQT